MFMVKMKERNVTIDVETLKALSVDARLAILKLLSIKKMTLSELATELNLAQATLSEHLVKLCHADLVAKEDTTRKWKYYSLTRKGRDIVEPRERSVIFALFALLLTGAWSGYMFLRQFFAQPQQEMMMRAQEVPNEPNIVWGYVFFIVLVLAGMCAGYLIRRYMR